MCGSKVKYRKRVEWLAHPAPYPAEASHTQGRHGEQAAESQRWGRLPQQLLHPPQTVAALRSLRQAEVGGGAGLTLCMAVW